VAFGLNRVGVGVFNPTQDLYGFGLHFNTLAFTLAGHQLAGADHRATGRQFLDLIGVIGQLVLGHNLDGVKAGAIVDLDKTEAGFGVATGANPAFDGYGGADGNIAAQQRGNHVVGHAHSLRWDDCGKICFLGEKDSIKKFVMRERNRRGYS